MIDTCSSVFRYTLVASMVAFLGIYSAADGGIAPALAANSSDDYLKAVEAEGNNLEFLGQAKKEQEMLMRHVSAPAKARPKSATASPKHTAKNVAPAPSPEPAVSVTQQEFEKSLRQHFPGSYALYTILEPHDKESVFREYENAKTDGTIRFLPAVTRLISLSSMSRTK